MREVAKQNTAHHFCPFCVGQSSAAVQVPKPAAGAGMAAWGPVWTNGVSSAIQEFSSTVSILFCFTRTLQLESTKTEARGVAWLSLTVIHSQKCWPLM